MQQPRSRLTWCLQVSVGPHAFTYDHVYGCGGSDLAGLYPECVQPLVDGLFKGYNATVFAYGQTGSGKTYTMGSGFTPGEESKGVIPEVLEELFGRISSTPDTDFTVRVSFVEIHRVRPCQHIQQPAAQAQLWLSIAILTPGCSCLHKLQAQYSIGSLPWTAAGGNSCGQ
jgi:hypothetical protein